MRYLFEVEFKPFQDFPFRCCSYATAFHLTRDEIGMGGRDTAVATCSRTDIE